jgi:hypothetical protein
MVIKIGTISGHENKINQNKIKTMINLIIPIQKLPNLKLITDTINLTGQLTKVLHQSSTSDTPLFGTSIIATPKNELSTSDTPLPETPIIATRKQVLSTSRDQNALKPISITTMNIPKFLNHPFVSQINQFQPTMPAKYKETLITWRKLDCLDKHSVFSTKVFDDFLTLYRDFSDVEITTTCNQKVVVSCHCH